MFNIVSHKGNANQNSQSKWRPSITETTTNADEDVGKRNTSTLLVRM
jgi:hypothetical protein